MRPALLDAQGSYKFIKHGLTPLLPGQVSILSSSASRCKMTCTSQRDERLCSELQGSQAWLAQGLGLPFCWFPGSPHP